MSVDRGRALLAGLWVVSSVALILLVLTQFLSGKYGPHWQVAFGWLLPSILPVVGLTLAGWSTEIKNGESRLPSKHLFWFAFTSSVVYLLLIVLLILLQPITTMTIFEVIEYSGWLLGGLQGVIIGLIGFFYFRVVAS